MSWLVQFKLSFEGFLFSHNLFWGDSPSTILAILFFFSTKRGESGFNSSDYEFSVIEMSFLMKVGFFIVDYLLYTKNYKTFTHKSFSESHLDHRTLFFPWISAKFLFNKIKWDQYITGSDSHHLQPDNAKKWSWVTVLQSSINNLPVINRKKLRRNSNKPSRKIKLGEIKSKISFGGSSFSSGRKGMGRVRSGRSFLSTRPSIMIDKSDEN